MLGAARMLCFSAIMIAVLLFIDQLRRKIRTSSLSDISYKYLYFNYHIQMLSDKLSDEQSAEH